MLRIEATQPGSLAADLNLQNGDRLLCINERDVDDLVDYHQAQEGESLRLSVLRRDGDIWELDVEKGRYEDLGLEFVHPEPQQCGNNCIFCFVHQLPRGLRRTLYIKDEDYRFSYLYGAYVTLSNLRDGDLRRIISQKLSPLYVSVHATDDAVREKLLGRKVPPLLPVLQELVAAEITLHCQIVLCPEWNDGDVLVRSIEDLARLFPQVASLAIVPVGLTRHRQHLPVLRKPTPTEAKETLQVIHSFQQRFLAQQGSRFVFAADELYLQAGVDIPALESYEELAQIENGVGLIAQFRQQAHEVLLEAEPLELERVTLVTGTSFLPELERFAERLALRSEVVLDVVGVENRLFGESVTVTGLLSGQDVLKTLQGRDLGDGVLIPEVMLKSDESVFLDDLGLDELAEALQRPVVAVENSPWGILDGLERLAGGPFDVVYC